MLYCVFKAARAGLQDCRAELHGLLKEEKLAGASLLILANKQDMTGALSAQQIEQACFQHDISSLVFWGP